MAHVLNDRVKETTTTTGTGTIDLAGANDTFETFVSGVGTTNTTYYCIQHQTANEFEVGLGTVTDASPDTLSRSTIISSSNSDSAVNFSSGTKDVFCTLPASKAVTVDSSNVVNIPAKISAPNCGWFPNHVSTVDIDNVANITMDNVFTDSFDVYDIVWHNVLFANTGNYGYVRLIDQSGSTDSSSNYRYYNVSCGTRGSESGLGADSYQTDGRASSSTQFNVWGQDEFLAGNDASEIVQTTLRLFNTRISSAPTVGFVHNCAYVSEDHYGSSLYLSVVKHGVNETHRGVYLVPSTGNFTSGQIHIYGYKLDGS